MPTPPVNVVMDRSKYAKTAYALARGFPAPDVPKIAHEAVNLGFVNRSEMKIPPTMPKP